MRVPRWLAWGLVVAALLTAGLLRRFHDQTPRAPHVTPVVGSLLFAAVVLLLLVAAREWRRGAAPGPGIRMGSLTPLLLMLLVEKWASIGPLHQVFYRIVPSGASESALDGYFYAFAGAGLLLVCLLLAAFSLPTRRAVWRLAHPVRWPAAAAGAALAVVGSYAVLALLAKTLGGSLQLAWGSGTAAPAWTLGGQTLLAFAEEVYYRGLLLFEMIRIAPRLGVRSPTARRWTALFGTSLLFGIEHLRLDDPSAVARQMVFTVSLGLLFGILVLVTGNLHFGAAIHAWINWLLLGLVPRFVDGTGQPALPPGTYIGITLILGFLLAFLVRRLRPLEDRVRPSPGSRFRGLRASAGGLPTTRSRRDRRSGPGG